MEYDTKISKEYIETQSAKAREARKFLQPLGIIPKDSLESLAILEERENAVLELRKRREKESMMYYQGDRQRKFN